MLFTNAVKVAKLAMERADSLENLELSPIVTEGKRRVCHMQTNYYFFQLFSKIRLWNSRLMEKKIHFEYFEQSNCRIMSSYFDDYSIHAPYTNEEKIYGDVLVTFEGNISTGQFHSEANGRADERWWCREAKSSE